MKRPPLPVYPEEDLSGYYKCRILIREEVSCVSPLRDQQILQWVPEGSTLNEKGEVSIYDALYVLEYPLGVKTDRHVMNREFVIGYWMHFLHAKRPPSGPLEVYVTDLMRDAQMLYYSFHGLDGLPAGLTSQVRACSHEELRRDHDLVIEKILRDQTFPKPPGQKFK